MFSPLQPVFSQGTFRIVAFLMNQVLEFFRGLFSTSEWPPRWQCGYWSDFHGWLYIISELLIWVAYFLIPLIILNYLSKKNTALKFNKAYVYFAAFILLCGSTHFFDAVMFWVPMYRLNALLRFFTAIVSLATVYHLIKILPEAFRQKTSVELEHEIHRREIAEMQLAASNKRLEEANKNLEAFAHVASHDLQEPLRKISTYTSMLVSKNETVLDDKSKELANKAISSAARLQTMVKNVLTLSTIDKDVSFAPVQLRPVMDTAIDDLEIKIAEKNAIITVGELPEVMGHKAYLTQLFFNLISNAIKFSKERPQVEITAAQNNGRHTIYVKDNGIGIEPENQERIFIAFQRLHAKSEYEGSGIGLAICQRIADIHNATIRVDSTPGVGTVIAVEFPPANA